MFGTRMAELIAPFRAVLSVYTSKNNVSWVLSDVLMVNHYLTLSGGMVTKRGTEKPSAKSTLANFKKVLQTIKELGITQLTILLKKAYGSKAHTPTTKNVSRLMTTTDFGLNHQVPIYNSTTLARSYVTPPYGSRGRRV